MAQIATIAVAAAGSIYKGVQAKKQKKGESRGLREAADRVRATSYLEAAEEERNKEFAYSRALAVAAASGGGVSDQGVVALLGDLNAEGEYRIMSRLWAGENEAEGLEFRAEAAKREGKAALTAGIISGVSSGVSSYQGYGK